MSYPTRIAYPSPPPTTNSLTSQQRSQLLRTTQKLGRLLGTTPALIEESDQMPSMPNLPLVPLNLQRLAVPLDALLSSVYDDDDSLVRYPSSDTAVSSASSHSSLKRNGSISSDSMYSTKSGRTALSPTQSVHANESWPKADRPFLRIAVKRPSKLEAIPQSPPATGAPPPYTYAPAAPHTSFTIHPIPATRSPAAAPPTSPAFALPSASSLRRQKMDRLRRTLGDGVPLDLVFPEEETAPVPVYRDSSDEDLPRRRQPAPQRIRSARDSLVIAQPQRYATPQPVRAAPPPPSPTPSWTSRAEKKLSIIAEREEPLQRSSADYEGDTEDAAPTRHRRSSRMYDGGDVRRIKRVPVPVA
ncbi:hypothetical protein FB451DRAFT_1166828 [Mycena latifolia]|nr:hypothetical protein FB451DRAFT_1166828 [Mycena latifolia]